MLGQSLYAVHPASLCDVGDVDLPALLFFVLLQACFGIHQTAAVVFAAQLPAAALAGVHCIRGTSLLPSSIPGQLLYHILCKQ